MTWLVVGAGAQGRITLELLRAAAPGEEALLVDDDPALAGATVAGVAVVPRAEVAARLDPSRARAIVAIGDNRTRLRLAGELEAAGFAFGTLVHPSAVVLPSATLGRGAVVAPGAVVQSGAVVGDHVLVNTGAIVEHDCVIEAGASLSPGCSMGGRVRVGAGAFVGAGATLCPRVTIGARSIIGAGAVVAADVPADSLAYGVPARVRRAVDPDRDWRRLL